MPLRARGWHPAWSVLSVVLLAVPLMGAKACAIHVPNAAWYGTWSVPARFALENGVHDQVCADDVFTPGDPLAVFSGVPEWLDGDPTTTATAPVNFSVSGPGGWYGTGAVFRASRGALLTYHFEGLAIRDRAACVRGDRCDYFAFGPVTGAPLTIAYEITSGWYDGQGHVCTNHYRGVPLDSTYCGGDPHPGCTDHQTAGWVPHLSNATINPCDWRPDVCAVGNMNGDFECITPGAPYPEDNDTCCSCGGMPADSHIP